MHLAVEPLGQPVQQTRLGACQVDAGDADLGESQLARPFPYLVYPLTAADHRQIVETTAAPDAGQGLCLRWASEDETARFAARLAALPGLRNAFVTLHGDLGAGKTTFTRHLLRTLGVSGRIKSPTYAVVEPHEAGDLAIWHFDFYRFHDPREWEDAGFRDLFTSPGLKLAEWPEQAAGLIPPADLAIYIEADDDGGRRVRLTAHTDSGRAMLQELSPGDA